MRFLVPMGFAIANSWVLAQEDISTLMLACREEPDSAERLSCYDEVAQNYEALSAESFDGVLSSSRIVPLGSVRALEADNTLNRGEEDPLYFLLLPRLSTENPNYFGSSSAYDDPHRGVETHIEFDLSLKYPFGESLLAAAKQNNPWLFDRFYFIYNGSYDFQYLTDSEAYDSNPIISKAQNPGAVLEWDLADGREKFRTGLYHYSNGQTYTETRTDDINFLIDNWGEEVGLERVSRSSYYWSMRYQKQSNSYGIIDSNWWQLQAELRHYFREDNAFYWNAPVPDLQRMSDYDGLRVLGEKYIPLLPTSSLRGLLRLEAKTGVENGAFLDKISTEITTGLNWGSLTLALYYYNGYGKDISTYHRRFHYWGAGIELR